MRVRARLTAAAAVLAIALSGCMTVHGETAVVPAATEEEARDAFEHYVETSNEAVRAYDAELNGTVETGPLGAIRNAELMARHELTPGGNEEFEPLTVSDTNYLIPQQAGWPKFFAVDTQANRTEGARWLLVFTRNGIEEDWTASHLSVVPEGEMPEFAEDEDGYLEDVLAGGETNSGLAMEPGEVPAAYAEYLGSGQGPFAEGAYTSEILAAREAANSDPAFVTEYQDQVSEDAQYAPVALGTEDGAALVLYSTLQHDKRTMAEGEPLEIDPLVATLIEGAEPTRSLTMERVGMYAALVPAGEGDLTLLSRVAGVVAASGE